MSYVVLGCDQNNGNDSKWQNTVKNALEKEGHKVEKLAIAPGPFSVYSYESKAKGKIGVYIMADSLFSVADLAYGNTQFKYGYLIVRGDLDRPRMKTMEHFQNNPIGKDPDCTSICDKLAGKSYGQMNPLIKNKCQVVFGRNPEEGAENLIKAMGGKTSNSDDKKSSSGGSIKEAIQKLLSHWDGEVECYIRGDTVHINKIRNPKKYHSSIIQEGVNVFLNSVTVTDVNPDTPNRLVVEWTGGTITFTDEHSIKRFGVVEKIVQATKEIETNKKQKNNTNSDELDTTNSEDEKDTNDKTTTIQKPIDNYDEALDFAHLYWNKMQRDNGRTLECQVLGSTNWKAGEWSKVYIPSYNIDGFMYITRISQSNDAGDWTANLSLVDYPPGWGKEEKKENSDNSDDEQGDLSSSKIDEIIKQITEEISQFSYSSSCSDGKCIKSGKKGDCWALSDYIYNRLKDRGISAKIHQYKTGSSNQHRQVKYKVGKNWVMFPYSKSGIDHNFYTNSIPSNTKIVKD